jgi:2-polyprenyl-6-methoxyphenol hydroxylase-like FAD-dependent oxidoreductase
MSNEANNQKVLISGAGAAGESAGYWLARYGYQATIIERAPEPRRGGFAVDLRGVAIPVAEQMGILGQCRDEGVYITEIVRLHRFGEPAWKTDGNFGAGEGVTGDLEILRDDLSMIMHKANRSFDNLNYIFDDSIASIHQDDNGVDVTFNNSPPQRYDLVIGGDGVHSKVRSLVFGPESQFMKPLGYYVGIYTIPNLFDMERQWFMCSLPAKVVSVMQYGHDKHTRGMFIFGSPPIEFDPYDPESQKKLIRDAFKDDHQYWGVRPLLDGLDDATDLYFDEVSQVHMPSWSKGRVALVGDASSAPTLFSGQGTSTALVGSYVLAGELKAAGGDHRFAFPAYNAAMRPFIDLNQSIPFGCEELTIPDSWEEIERRDAAVSEILANPGEREATGEEDDASAAALITRAANGLQLKTY